MSHYFWKGIDIDGTSCEGAFNDNNLENARTKLIQEGFYKCRFWKIPESSLHKSLNNSEITHFILQMQRLLKSGVELDDAIGFVIGEQEDRNLCYIFCRMREDLRDGVAFSSALQRFPSFPLLVGKLIEVAESSGKLTEVLQMLLDFYQYQQKVMQDQRRLLNYPLVVLLVFVVMSLGAAVFMVPMFQRMYANMGDELFWMTRVLLNFSDSIRFQTEYWLIGCGSLIIFLSFLHRKVGWYWFWKIIPGGKKLDSTIRMLFYSKAMEIMLRSGVHLQEALILAEEMFPVILRKKLVSVRLEVDSGISLKDAYATNSLFSPMFVQLVALGESTGHLSSSFERIGIQNQESLEKMMGWINALIEPFFMILIAFGVLGFLLSMYLPLFKMAERF